MKTTKDGIEFNDSFKGSLQAFIEQNSPQQIQAVYGPAQQNGVINVEDRFRKMAKPLIAWSLGTRDFTQLVASSPTANEHIELFLFARSPDSFCITGSELGHEVGYVLYHFDLFKPGTAGGI